MIALEDIISAALSLAEDELVERFQAGATITELAKAAGRSRDWVRTRLIRAGAYEERPGQQPRRAKCGAGIHDMEQWGREKKDGTGRECVGCIRIRDRENKRRRYWQAKGVSEPPPLRVRALDPAPSLQGGDGRPLGDREEDLSPGTGVSTVGDLQVAVVPRHPADGDQVAGDIEPTLAAEDNVVQCRGVDVPTADPAAGLVPLQYEIPNVRGN